MVFLRYWLLYSVPSMLLTQPHHLTPYPRKMLASHHVPLGGNAPPTFLPLWFKMRGLGLPLPN